MKFGRLRTLRGQLTVVGGVARKNVIVADGLVNYGLKILKYVVWPEDILATQKFVSILSLDTIITGSLPNAGDNRQIAWIQADAAAGNIWPPTNIIDPDHIVNRDLFLSFTDGTTDGVYNYLIEAQAVMLTDDEAIITIIKETSQS